METQEEKQFKYGAYIPADSTLKWSHKHIFEIWPELTSHSDSIHIVYAGANFAYSFHNRTSESIVEEIFTEYKNGKRNFLYECLNEGLMCSHILLLTEALLALDKKIKNNISVVYLTGDLNPLEGYRELCKIYNLPQCFHVVSGSQFEKNSTKFLNFTVPYKTEKKLKKFLCFNKLPRQHRIDLINELIKLDLVNESYYSFDIHENLLSTFENIDRYDPLIKYKNNLPLRLNDLTERNNPVDVRLDDLVYFENSLFSVVTETLFYDILRQRKPYQVYMHVNETYPGFFCSEKIYKCLAIGHPFIVVSTPEFLNGLRSKGYKTFDPFINESYDYIVDDGERLSAIVNEINRLCKLSDKEQLEFVENIKPIIEHNVNHLKEMVDFRVTKDLLSLLK